MFKVAELIIVTGKLKHDNELFIELEKHPYSKTLLEDLIIAAEELKKKLKIKETKKEIKVILDNGKATFFKPDKMTYKDAILTLNQTANTLKYGLKTGKIKEVK